MGKEFGAAVSQRGDVSVIAITGDVTPSTGEAIEEAYRRASAAGARKILLRFDGENYINSGGIAILIGIASESHRAGQAVRVTGLSDHFRKIFAIVGLTKYTALFDSEAAALENF